MVSSTRLTSNTRHERKITPMDRFRLIYRLEDEHASSKGMPTGTIAIVQGKMEPDASGPWVRYSDADKLRVERDDAIKDLSTYAHAANAPGCPNCADYRAKIKQQELTSNSLFEGYRDRIKDLVRDLRDERANLSATRQDRDTDHLTIARLADEVSRWRSECRRMAQPFAELGGWNYDMNKAPKDGSEIEGATREHGVRVLFWSRELDDDGYWISPQHPGEYIVPGTVKRYIPYAWRKVVIPPLPPTPQTIRHMR